MQIQITKIHPDAVLPHYAHPGDSGMDLYSIENVTIAPGDTAFVHTGIKIAVPEHYEAQVRPKSGLALKHAISIVNTPGTVDSGYRGELCVILINHGREPFQVKKHTNTSRIAQRNNTKQSRFFPAPTSFAPPLRSSRSRSVVQSDRLIV